MFLKINQFIFWKLRLWMMKECFKSRRKTHIVFLTCWATVDVLQGIISLILLYPNAMAMSSYISHAWSTSGKIQYSKKKKKVRYNTVMFSYENFTLKNAPSKLTIFSNTRYILLQHGFYWKYVLNVLHKPSQPSVVFHIENSQNFDGVLTHSSLLVTFNWNFHEKLIIIFYSCMHCIVLFL